MGDTGSGSWAPADYPAHLTKMDEMLSKNNNITLLTTFSLGFPRIFSSSAFRRPLLPSCSSEACMQQKTKEFNPDCIVPILTTDGKDTLHSTY